MQQGLSFILFLFLSSRLQYFENSHNFIHRNRRNFIIMAFNENNFPVYFQQSHSKNMSLKLFLMIRWQLDQILLPFLKAQNRKVLFWDMNLLFSHQSQFYQSLWSQFYEPFGGFIKCLSLVLLFYLEALWLILHTQNQENKY